MLSQKKGLPSEIESYYPNDALVDPVKDSHLHSDRLLKRLEKNILRIYRKQNNQKIPPKLSKLERFRLKMYSLARKYNLVSEFSDETVVQFCANQDRTAAYKAAKTAYLQSQETEADNHVSNSTEG